MPPRAVRTILVLCLLALGLSAAAASAKTIERTVRGELVFANAQNPEKAGNCSAIVFVQWADVPGTTSAQAHYTDLKGPSSSGSLEPPFNDTYEWVATYTAPAGFHWIQIGKSWSDGPIANTCADMSERHKTMFGPTATVRLQVELDPRLCTDARAALTKRNKAIARLQRRIANARTRRARRTLRGTLAKQRALQLKAARRVTEMC